MVVVAALWLFFVRIVALPQSLLNNISPLGWKHINFLGEYKFNLNQNGHLKDLNL